MSSETHGENASIREKQSEDTVNFNKEKLPNQKHLLNLKTIASHNNQEEVNKNQNRRKKARRVNEHE